MPSDTVIFPSPAMTQAIAAGFADGLTELELAGQVGVALKLLLIVARRLPVDLQAETAGEIIIALARDLPRGEA